MSSLLDAIRAAVRRLVASLAKVLNRLTGGRIHPNLVTIIGLLMHIPIAVLVAMGDQRWLAVALLIVFGLFDVLDGELARLQGRSSPAGMLLDASTDRMKETILYTGAAWYLAGTADPRTAVWAVAACGASICVSYVKAKGEAAVAAGEAAIEHAVLNRMFKDGLLTFETRMVIFIVGLCTGQVVWALAVIAVLASFTALQRLQHIMKVLTAHA
jgi:phosphatidylglycerophosphate synthase